MTLHVLPDLLQGSEEWHDQRRGLITASVIGGLITTGPPDATTLLCPTCGVTGGPCISLTTKERKPIKTIHDARTAIAAGLPPVYTVADNDTSRGITTTLAAERITGWTEPTSMTPDMWRGVEAEPFARAVYDEHIAPVTEVGFMLREEHTWKLGYSPDGLVGDDGAIEVKSPRAKTHLRTILDDTVPARYMPQLQSGLLVTSRKWIDFVSYVGGMPLYVRRVYPDPAWFTVIQSACITFETNVTAIVNDYQQKVTNMPKTERIDYDLMVG